MGEVLLINADGGAWRIVAGDPQAAAIVPRLAEVMQLGPVDEQARRLVVLVSNPRAGTARRSGLVEWGSLTSQNEAPVVCMLSPIAGDTLFPQFLQLSLILCLPAQVRGGLLIHGALAEKDGYGVILAGPGGSGKTTASQRLVPPWRSLCDDLTLVVRDHQGIYWAHPWPTWSRFMSGGPGGTWDVQHSVPLKGIFFLAQAAEDRVESVGAGQTVCLLVESTEQALYGMPHNVPGDMVQTLRVQRFDNICALAQAVPCYVLHASLTGAFWREIDHILAQGC